MTISTVPVGYAGNAPDPATGSNYGAVPYNFRIGTYDVTNAQYVEFLNTKASAADPYGLWNRDMDPAHFEGSTFIGPIFEGAIRRTGDGPYSYSVRPGYANKPVVHVSWFDAIRFVNWLANGQGNRDTESGTYTITNGGYNSGTVTVPSTTQRAAWAATNSLHWLLPSENEWYKATYYNAVNGAYYAYPFQSDSEPSALAPPGDSNSGPFSITTGGFPRFTTQYPAYNYDGNESYITDVGAYPNSMSPFGSFDMSSDATQWTDTAAGSYYALRGASWGASTVQSSVGNFGDAIPTFGGVGIGFRMASVGNVPEPSTGLLAGLACGVLVLCRKPFKRSV